MQLTKKIGQFRQWTGEKIGNTQRTERGEEFARYEQDTNVRNEQTTLVHDACQSYLRSIGKRKDDEKPKKTPMEQMGSAMVMYGNQLPSDSTYGQTLQAVGEAHEKIAVIQYDYMTLIHSGYVNRLGQVLHDMKEFYALKKKMENRRLDFDAKHNKVQKLKKDNPELLEECNYAKAKYEESLNDVTQRMVRLNENDEDQLQDLLDFVDAEVIFHQKSLKVLLQLQSSLANIPRGGSNPIRRNNSGYSDDLERKPSKSFDEPALRRDPSEKKLLYAAQAGSLVYPAQGPNGLQAPPIPRSYSGASQNVPTQNTQSYLKQVKVLFDFDGETEEELSIRKGDIVNVTLQIDEGWWEGELADGSGRCGMFPSNYCEVITKPAPIIPSRPSFQDPEPENPAISRTHSFNRPSSVASNGFRQSSAAPPPVVQSPAARQSTTTSRSFSGPSIQSKQPPSVPRRSASTETGPCSTCECTNFVPHAFRPGQCNECYHKH